MLFIFEQLGRLHLSASGLWGHLEVEGIDPTMFATDWIMTIFCRGFSFDLVTRVWDIFLNECSFKIVYRVSLALLKSIEKPLLAAKFDGIMGIIKELPQRTDAESLMQIAWALPLREAQIAELEERYLADKSH